MKSSKKKRTNASKKANKNITELIILDSFPPSDVKNEPEDVSNDLIDRILKEPSLVSSRQILCNLCQKSFSKESNLNRHYLNAHSNVKFECCTCLLKFPRRDSLARHINRKHNREFDEEGSFECGHCCKRYKGKDALKRHIRLTHLNDVELANEIEKKKVPSACDKCGKKFTTNYSLNRHLKNIHTKTNTFICYHCEQTFYRKDALARHIRIMHMRSQDEGYTFECYHCPKLFKEKDGLARHIRLTHFPDMKVTSEKNASKNKGRSICLLCEASFSKESNLRRHCRNFHNIDNDTFKCVLCGKKFARKDTLMRHINRKHVHLDYEEYSFECHHCSKKFREKNSVAQHIRSAHVNNTNEKIPAKATEFKCLKCEEAFCARYLIKKHYRDAHNIIMTYDELKFKSLDEFKTWKKNMQRQTVTQFTSRSAWTASSHAGYRFCCHRSGMYDSSCKGRVRQRRLKRFGSKKLQGYCPAEILVKIREGMCYVTFQKTHVGHEVSDRKELRYIHLDKDEKVDIVTKLQDGVPLKVILKEETANDETDQGNRLSVFNYNDGYNIARRFGVSRRLLGAGDDTKDKIDMDSFIEQNKDGILFYKEPMVENTEYKTLKDEDFVVIIMKKTQEESLKRYGHNIVALDSIQGTNPCDFLLHTLLVVDIDFEGIPVAFLFSNRGGKDVIDIFFSCIRDKIGIVKTKTLMTDLDEMYFHSWVDCMSPPEYHVYCTWHIREEWQKNSTKIADRKKRTETCQTLFAIANELNPKTFEIKLHEFLNTEDEDLRDFIEYFRTTQIDTNQCWANCYRKLAGVHANIHVNVFRRVLKMKKATTLFDCLQCIHEYLVAKDNDVRVKHVRGKRLSKRDYLRKRHDDAVKHSEETGLVIEIGHCSTWNVGFFESSEEVEMYSVEKQEDKECEFYKDVTCQLKCEDCNICFHEYRCSCVDSCVKSNMCKHIHAIGISLQNCQILENVIVDENGFIVSDDGIVDEDAIVKEDENIQTFTLVEDDDDMLVANEIEEAVVTYGEEDASSIRIREMQEGEEVSCRMTGTEDVQEYILSL